MGRLGRLRKSAITKPTADTLCIGAFAADVPPGHGAREFLTLENEDLSVVPRWRQTLSDAGSSPKGFEVKIDGTLQKFFTVKHAIAYAGTNDKQWLYAGRMGRRPVRGPQINIAHTHPDLWMDATRARFQADPVMRHTLRLTKPAKLLLIGMMKPTRLFFLESLRDQL